ncbi:hypothetical protein E2542_SST30909 [Spatholobus suberectus]|nr:hypothetical protein E2542_SST30909 [Spatholobus suberectus]
MKVATISGRSIFTTKLNFQKLRRERECVCVVLRFLLLLLFFCFFFFLHPHLLQIPLFFFRFSLYNLHNPPLFLSPQLPLLARRVWIHAPLNFATVAAIPSCEIRARCSNSSCVLKLSPLSIIE